MSYNISTYIQRPAFTLAAGGSANCDVRLTDIKDIRVMLTQTWASMPASGIAINLYPGFGGTDPAENSGDPIPHVLSNPSSAALTTVPVFADNFAPVLTPSGSTAIVQPSAANLAPKTVFYLNSPILIWSNWVRIQMVNLDPSKSCQITLDADIG